MDETNTKHLHQNNSLSKKVVQGGFWIFTLRIISRVLGLIRTIILARLLVPADFGLLGIGMLSIATIESFSQTGFSHALIQKKENIDSYLDTAWTVSAIRGIILFLILFVSAPLIAKFFNSDQTTQVIRVISISLIITGFKNIGVLFFFKELEFNKQFIYELSGTLFDLSVAITLAFILHNVWALIWGGLAGNVLRFCMSYLLHPYRPKLKIKKSEVKELFRFGKWIIGSGIIGFLINRGDDIVVGKIIGVTALGIYQMAYLFANLPATEITHVVAQVTFPAYSKLQDNIPQLRSFFLKVLRLTIFFSAPIAGGIFVLIPEFTKLIMGNKWMPMLPALQILVLAGLIRSLAATTGPIFYAVGRPQIETKWQAIRLTILAILIYPFTIHWGITGTAMVVSINILVSTIGYCLAVLKITECTLQEFIKGIALPFINTIIMISVVFIIKSRIINPEYLQLFVLISIGVTSYMFIAFLFDKFFNYGMVKTFRENLLM